MRLLLDESVPMQLRSLLGEHDVWTVRNMGWNGRSNGELLALAREEFDAFITLDQNLEYQQDITGRNIPIIVLIARRSGIDHLEPLIPRVLQALQNLKRRHVLQIGTL